LVHAKPRVSGRLRTSFPIGEYRSGAYRVRRDLLDVWGGLSVKDGFIQRSVVPPRFIDPKRFLTWFKEQDGQLVAENA
jgi:hypothetical protein